MSILVTLGQVNLISVALLGIYMTQPEGCVVPGQENKVWKLLKSLYGLKQAPKEWHEKLDSVLLCDGFLPNNVAPRACVIFSIIFGCKYGALLQPYNLNVGIVMDFFFLSQVMGLAHLCPHPPSINRTSFSSLKHTLPYSYSLSLVLSFFLSYISSLILGLFIYSFLRVILLVLRSLGISRSSCCILGGLHNTPRISP